MANLLGLLLISVLCGVQPVAMGTTFTMHEVESKISEFTNRFQTENVTSLDNNMGFPQAQGCSIAVCNCGSDRGSFTG